MDRNDLIDYIVSQEHDIKAVLQGLETEHLERIKHWYESQEERANLLHGECAPWNVYLIQWEDGVGYVGMTGQPIMKRMEHHFKKIHLGRGNYYFVLRHERGIGYRFHCLHTNLTKQRAEVLEIQEIRSRNNLLNIAHNQNLLNHGKASMRVFLRDRQRSVESKMRKAIKAGLRAGTLSLMRLSPRCRWCLTFKMSCSGRNPTRNVR